MEKKVYTKKEVLEMAKVKGIKQEHKINIAEPIYKTEKKTKTQLIREIQSADGFNGCFKTEIESCPHSDCCWHTECQK